MTIGVARALPPFWLGFDCLGEITDAMLDEAPTHNFKWCARYLENLTPAERDRIFARGLGILPLTEATVKEPLTAGTGLQRGAQTITHARALEMPPGPHIVIDFEAPAAGSDAPAHINNMAAIFTAPGAGFGAALYVAVPQTLGSGELFSLKTNRYIKGGGRIVDRFGNLAEPQCGWCAVQLEPLEGIKLAGKPVDVQISKLDYLGRGLTLWWPS